MIATAGLEHSALDPATLSPAAQKALAAAPARAMAARGLSPLPNPRDMTSVLYQLAATDPALAAAAQATASGLPEKVLLGALGDAALDPRVVDWLAARSGERASIFDAAVTAPAVADQTVAALAARGDARQVDLIAENEQRLLRHPEIIAALYTNARARMSTVDRVVELAVRNGVRVPGLACWDEVARALAGGGGAPASAADDALFAHAATALAQLDDSALVTGDADAAPPGGEIAEVTDAADGDPQSAVAAKVVDERQIPINRMNVSSKIRLATLGNAFARAVLIRDPLKMVALAAIKSPGVSEIEASRYAGNASLHEDVIRHIAQRREWTKLYGVKLSLCMNPKTPITDTTRMLAFLREKDLRNVIRSKGIPSAVVAQARKLIAQRTPGGGK